MTWRSHASAFCRDLDLCDASIGGEYWGANNADPSRIEPVAAYYLKKHDTLDLMGKGMLIAFLCASASKALVQRELADEESVALASALATAKASPELSSYVWYFIDEDDASDPFTAWLATTFDAWQPKRWP
jgi:hypothetical protein